METNFDDFDFNKQVLDALKEEGYLIPTPIQAKALKPAMNGQDIIGIAQTGTGKTAAYVLPIIMRLKYPQGDSPRALILAPTRELSMQISQWVSRLAKYTGLRHCVVYGGVGTKLQKEQIAAGVDILIATPGRFMELYFSEDIIVKKINCFVLDEADKMLDMGFMPAINGILEVIPRKRQNMLFSATMSDKVQRLAGNFIEFPTIIEVEQQATPATKVVQKAFLVPNIKSKIRLLEYFIKDIAIFNKVIIFCKTRSIADNVFKYIARTLGENNVRVIHANKGQNTRINSMNDFRNSDIRILVATDVAARGIDIEDVSHVINFDVPLIYEDYVHRIGRTGRADKSGASITFINKAEEYHIKKIEKLMRQNIPMSPWPKEVELSETPFEEEQDMLKEIDLQKKKEDPNYQGAFHEKKVSNTKGDAAKAKKKALPPNFKATKKRFKNKNEKSRN